LRIEQALQVVELGDCDKSSNVSRSLTGSGQAAPVLATRELAGHADLSTTQCYIHLSPAATEDAIRLLDGRQSGLESSGHHGRCLSHRPADFFAVMAQGFDRYVVHILQGSR
jgi:hypothetical protein